jgi:hypothetical protein
MAAYKNASQADKPRTSRQTSLANSRTGSRNNSKNNSPMGSPFASPNKYSILGNDQEEDGEEPWQCELCDKLFSDPSSKVLECQRCQKHFCIKCLKKPEAEYNALSKSDSMWFCIKCREVVEKHIMTDLKIEERCRQIMSQYEDRISSLEELGTNVM